ncbi:hypothetical protein FNV43_RR24386 [Rhamnella rubrinervis]|uniref:Uncharacterized protein n=1 Tax=Rhamnella rubrinervis TaxID=2594499 RepID=A0A8K0GP24_9ROSA|nr:hypothetical protein FNV43_RR24386 [Rhamnella rubrinervis]
MGKRELKTTIPVLISLVLLLSLTFQTKSSAATGGGTRRFSNKGCVGTTCGHLGSHPNHQQPLDRVENVGDDPGDDHHDEAAPGDDYDFYRQYGDVPSPGIGH